MLIKSTLSGKFFLLFSSCTSVSNTICAITLLQKYNISNLLIFFNPQNVNTKVCEQLLSWLSKFGSITKHMNRYRFLFLMLYVLDKHNDNIIVQQNSGLNCKFLSILVTPEKYRLYPDFVTSNDPESHKNIYMLLQVFAIKFS